MSNQIHHEEILGELGQRLLALFCSQDRVSDEEIANSISKFNSWHGTKVTWQHAAQIINRLRMLYPSSPLPDWVSTRYEFVKPLASGATAKVCLAINQTTGEKVAIKLLNSNESIKRVQRETEILRGLQSDYIVRLTDAIFNFDAPSKTHAALVMEFVDGEYLDQVIKRNYGHPHDLHESIGWMAQVARALHDAHDQGVIHRDIKPANLVVAHENRAIKLLDFGLASNVKRSAELTTSGDLLGTPHYMAPEQSRDPGTPDPRNDIYSYGATFYHLLTGTTPFEGDYIDLIAHHRYSILESPAARNPNLTPTINHIIEKCMAKNARDRYQSFEQILQELNPTISQNETPLLNSTCNLESPQNSTDVQRFLFSGDRQIEVVSGDLLEHSQDCEVIVVCDDSQLTMGGGTAQRILDEAGPAYFQATRVLAPALPGRVITSTAGALPQRFVFHAITLPNASNTGRMVTPTPDLIRSLIDSCFYHAESLGVRSITMPLLGAGYAGMNPQKCYDTMMEHVCRELEFGLTPVYRIRLVIPEGVNV